MRKNNFKQAFRDLRTKLKSVSANGENAAVMKLNDAVLLIDDFLKDLREQVAATAFPNKFDEIYFFKFEKPEYFSFKIFHVAVFNLLQSKPVGTNDIVKAYFLEELRFIARFFKQHAFHYEYFRSGFTELDELLFLRGMPLQSALVPVNFVVDPDFSTGGDMLFAQFMAYEQLQDFILDELKKLDQAIGPAVVAEGGKKWFDWTGEVINLVELGYGLYLSKQIGHGKAGLQEIFNWLEETFGVEIGIPANRFREIKRRKRLSRTFLTDLIRDALIGYMEEDNE